MINPQAYWYSSFPKQSMLNQTGSSSADYPRERGELCRLLPRPVGALAPKPVVVSGQAYADGTSREDAVAKLEHSSGTLTATATFTG